MTTELLQDETQEDLFPSSEAEASALLAGVMRNFNSAEGFRQQHEDRWSRYYKHVHHYIDVASATGSALFMPITKTAVATIMPRILAQLPKPIVKPVEEEDVAGAAEMEEMLSWSADQSKLWLEMVKCALEALYYGTGILKTTPTTEYIERRRKVPKMRPMMSMVDEPVMDPETARQMMDLEGRPMFNTNQVPMVDPLTGEPAMEPEVDAKGKPVMETTTERITFYIGPKAEYVSDFDLYPDPLASGFEDAEYVIHRAYKSKGWVETQIKSGYFKAPPGMDAEQFLEEVDAHSVRLQGERGLGGAVGSGEHDRRTEFFECWYRDGRVVTVLNRREVVRVVKHPYKHGRMPFIRIVDDLNPGEFWGSGEAELLEGIQDAVNAIWNQRIDEVRLRLSPPLLLAKGAVQDLRELTWGAGAVMEVETKDMPLSEVIREAQIGEVNSSAYEEVERLKSMADEASAVSGYNKGVDSPQMADTATGTAIIAEQGNTRFSFKVKIAELTGWQELFRQYAALLQQFTPEGFKMRITGADGKGQDKVISASALYGAFDFEVEAESSTQTESVRKQMAIDFWTVASSALDPVTQMPVFDITKAASKLLESWGIKDVDAYLFPKPELPGAPGAMMPGQMPGGQMTGEEEALAMGPMAPPVGPSPNGGY